jgi:hypothetical protein
MANPTCKIDGCEKLSPYDGTRGGLGYCPMHSMRFRKHGDPHVRKTPEYDSDVCAIAGCETPRSGREWCNKHYTRWLRHGDPETVKTPRTNPESTVVRWSRHVKRGRAWECWEWTGTKTPLGYGFMSLNTGEQERFGVGRTAGAYRVAYWLFEGPVPEGLELDHLCRNPSCVNVNHLEPVTHKVNTLRSDAPAAIHARKTHCIRGHAFDDGNTYYPSTGGRQCRACRRWRREQARA